MLWYAIVPRMAAFSNYRNVASLLDQFNQEAPAASPDARYARYGSAATLEATASARPSYNHLGSATFVDQRRRQYTPVNVDMDQRATEFMIRLPKGVTRRDNAAMRSGEPMTVFELMDFPQVGETLELHVIDKAAEESSVIRVDVAAVVDVKRATATVLLRESVAAPSLSRAEEDRRARESANKERRRLAAVAPIGSAATTRDRERDRK